MTDAAFWDGIAEKYSRGPIKDLPAYEATLEKVSALLRAEDRVLELGCGTGGTARRLAPRVAEYVASDVSAEMIRIAEARQADEGTQVRFRTAAAGEPIEGGPFDVVLAFNLLHLTGDLPATLAAIHRQVRPGGLFIAKTPCLGDMSALIRIAVPVMRAFGKAPAVTFFTAQELVAAIRAAGFEVVEETRFGSDRHRPFTAARRR